MHHHHEGKPALRRHIAEELLQRRDAARGSTKPYDRGRFIRIAPLPRAIARVRGGLIRRCGIESGLFLFFSHERG
jgi:hypothetical protein